MTRDETTGRRTSAVGTEEAALGVCSPWAKARLVERWTGQRAKRRWPRRGRTGELALLVYNRSSSRTRRCRRRAEARLGALEKGAGGGEAPGRRLGVRFGAGKQRRGEGLGAVTGRWRSSAALGGGDGWRQSEGGPMEEAMVASSWCWFGGVGVPVKQRERQTD